MVVKHNKKNIILDLDNTLLSAITIKEYNDNKDKSKDKIKKLKKIFLYDDKKNKTGFVIFFRPYLNEFLNYLFENFNVAVWSAGNKTYVNYIVDKIIYKDNEKRTNKRKLKFVLNDETCDKSLKLYKSIKDLRYVWDVLKKKNFNKSNTMIIDDLKEVYEAQPENTLKIKPFEFFHKRSENDKILQKISLDLEKFRLKKIEQI